MGSKAARSRGVSHWIQMLTIRVVGTGRENVTELLRPTLAIKNMAFHFN